ncbi:hypothetical protein [Halomonas huangheensis]|uniref:Lipoprotein n=1 Tax=Halomonas huangheensis TaxID=1178482 RepID=W1N4Y9_9GAMM|nr:hypothetical protein [Halomonas huangheensis]ALM52079.1 hypothetical protein AR456_07120 [Halomonas huangheensis]ERL50637.1 hypothetical protein BJB45_05765 [Halomonas huangheensis]
MNAKPMLALTAALWLGIGLGGCSDGDDESTEQSETTTQNQSSDDTTEVAAEDTEETPSTTSEPMSESDRQAKLEDSLRANFDPQLGEVRYLIGWADLNGDDQEEAVVHVVGPMVCGTGGCDTLILQAQDNAWQVISAQPTTEPPVQIASSSHEGWQDLLVQRHVDAGEPNEVVRLSFDGQSYIEAEEGVADAEATRTLIEPFDSMEDAEALFHGEVSGSYEGASLVDEEEAATAAEPQDQSDEATEGSEQDGAEQESPEEGTEQNATDQGAAGDDAGEASEENSNNN